MRLMAQKYQKPKVQHTVVVEIPCSAETTLLTNFLLRTETTFESLSGEVLTLVLSILKIL